MLDGEKLTQELDLNRNVKVKIQTKRLGEEYYSTVTMTGGVVSKTAPAFKDKEEVANMIREIDLEEEQQSMDLEEGNEE